MTSIERKPFPSLEGLRNIRRLMATQNPKTANVKVEDLIDSRIIRKLDETVSLIKSRRSTTSSNDDRIPVHRAFGVRLVEKGCREQSGHPPNILSEDKKAALGANLGRRVCT